MPGAQYSLAFESFGVVAEVVTDDRELFEGVPAVLPPGWRKWKGSPVGARFEVLGDGTITLDGGKTVRTVRQWHSTLPTLGSALRKHVAEHAPGYVFVHAGVVAVEGAAVVIPGRSMSGKTTLVAELVRGGARYFSDEYAVVDGDGLIHPYPDPLAVRDASGESRFKDAVRVPGSQTGTDPIRAGIIVVTEYRDGASWRPEERASAEGALALLEHAVVARVRPGAALAAARRVAEHARVISSPRGESGPVAEALLGLALSGS